VLALEAEAASGSQKEVAATLDQTSNFWLRSEARALSMHVICREWILSRQLDAVSGMWTVTILTDRKGAIADAFRDQCVHDLGIAVRREVDDMFQHSASCWQRYTHPRDEL